MLQRIVRVVFGDWVREIYTSVYQSGRDPVDICAGLTGVPAEHWQDVPLRCEALIDTQVNKYIIIMGAVMHVYVVVTSAQILGAGIFRLVSSQFYTRPKVQYVEYHQ